MPRQSPKASILAPGAAAICGEAGAEADWAYQGDGGPPWGSLNPAFAACDLGKAQSPIDLKEAETRALSAIQFHYARGAAVAVNTGHSIQVNLAPGSGVVLDGVRYELSQFHFHHGSEHTVEGRRFAMEMHLVHQAEDGSLAVVGVLLNEGESNSALAPVWERMPAQPSLQAEIPGGIDPSTLLPEQRSSWRYDGSLTTPPCTEGVRWIMMTDTIPVSAGQAAAYGALHPDTYRDTQPLNGRVVLRDTDNE